MTAHPRTRPAGAADQPRDARLDAAISSINARTDARWVEIADRVRARALQTTRRSLPVNANAPSGPIHVSEQVLITHLRAALSAVREAHVEDIAIATGTDNSYTGVTVFISARYGEPLIPIADTMRNLAAAQLRELLGTISPPITVNTMEIHIDDVHEQQ